MKKDTVGNIAISLLLLGIAIGLASGIFFINNLSAIKVKHKIAAINLAREKIEMIKGMDFSQVPAQAGAESVLIDPAPRKSGYKLNGQRATTVLDVYGNSKEYKVIVSVKWAEKNGSAVLEEKVITLISQR